MRGVEIVPEGPGRGAGEERAGRGGVEPREVPRGHHALAALGRQVGFEPLLLRRAAIGPWKLVVAVQDDDVPRPEVKAVVALAAVAGGGAEVAPRRGRVSEPLLGFTDH